MKLNIISKDDFLNLIYKEPARLYERINAPEAFVVKNFYKAPEILNIRNKAFEWGISTAATWQPCYDGIEDYHRVHDDYPQSYVKSKMHAYYYHGFYEHNANLFNYFSEIFKIKNFLAGYPECQFIKNIPSQGQIARVNLHNYPVGGGRQLEHIDPVSKFATIQTIVQASQFGKDFHSGGLFARGSLNEDKFYIDPETEIGDLIVLSPGIPHGVDEIDKNEVLNWELNKGRWMVMPIIINSDYPGANNAKPKQI